uniref:HAD family hydrolase n=1 Tax=Roseihalotalea indica TaxID=2867963 RepID=A0AA49JI51_9BACT|nr:HAD family hydrolase [Tunicatimonas sp. TK19036]
MPKHRIAVFDINGTLYNKKSKEEFFKYICYRKNYKLFSLYHLVLFKLLGKLRLINQTEFKENFFNYLDGLPPDKVDRYAREYWSVEYPYYFNDKLLKRVEELRQDGVKIVFASGGLDVYMKPLLEFFEADASFFTQVRYTNKTYKVVGEACKGKEKIRAIQEYFGDESFTVVEAYSDDPEAVLDMAQKPYLVKEDGQIVPYEK